MDKNNKWLLLLVVIFFTGYGMYSTKYDKNKAFSKRFHLKYFWSFWLKGGLIHEKRLSRTKSRN